MNKVKNETTVAFHPGYYVKEYLSETGMNQHELAKRLNTTEKTVSELVNGKIDLNNNLINGLSLVLGTSKSLWENLDKAYQRDKLKIREQNMLKKERAIESEIDYSYWEKMNLVKSTRITNERINELRKYLKVSSLKVLENKNFLVQYKTAVKNVTDKNIINSNAWIQTALNIGVSREVDSINLTYLKKSLRDIRDMTTEEPKLFMPKLRCIFKKSGIVFVILPNLKNCGVNGAVKWLGKDKVLLALNDRRKYADVFWFALFHEIKHVFQKKTAHMIVSIDNMTDVASNLKLSKLEDEADDFAKNELINKNDYHQFVNNHDFSDSAIQNFATRIGIHPGIVVGRLQRERLIPYHYLNQLKVKYEVRSS